MTIRHYSVRELRPGQRVKASPPGRELTLDGYVSRRGDRLMVHLMAEDADLEDAGACQSARCLAGEGWVFWTRTGRGVSPVES